MPEMLPDTIKHVDAFLASPPAGFDGVFDWEWMEDLFDRGIKPMDIDCLVHVRPRPDGKNRFLVLETKDLGKAVPGAQLEALNALHDIRPACFTVMLLWTKARPIWGEWWPQGSLKKLQWSRPAEAEYRIREWFQAVERGDL